MLFAKTPLSMRKAAWTCHAAFLLVLGWFIMPVYCSWAEETPAYPGNILSAVPADAKAILLVPSLNALQTQYDRLMADPVLREMLKDLPPGSDALARLAAQEIGLADITTFAGLRDTLGVDGAKPAAVVMNAGPEDLGFLIPVANTEKTTHALSRIPGASLEATPLEASDVVAQYDKNNQFGYFLRNNYAILSGKLEVLNALAAAETPRSTQYGTAGFPVAEPGEIALILDLKNLVAATASPELADLAPYVATMATFADEAVFALNAANGGLKARLAAHDAVEAAFQAPGPLALPGYFADMGAALVVLRFPKSLKDFLAQQLETLIPDPVKARQIKGIYTMVSTSLGEELAVSFNDMTPQAVKFQACVQLPSPDQIMMFLYMFGLPKEPESIHKDVPLLAVKNIYPDTSLYVANCKGLFLAGTDLEQMKRAIDSASEGAASPSRLPKQVLERGNYGFALIDMARLSKIAAGPEGGTAATGSGYAAITLEQQPTWRQLALDIPNVAVAAEAISKISEAREKTRKSAQRAPSTDNAQISPSVDNAQSASSANNLKQMGLVCKMYANEAKKACFPPISSKPGQLMCAGQAIYPEYLTDVSILFYPTSGGAPEFNTPEERLSAIDDQSYIYLSHATRTQAEGLAWAGAYSKAVQEGTGFEGDFDTPAGKLYRLREGVEGWLGADPANPASGAQIQSQIVVMFERPRAEGKPINVLFMDGHVEKVGAGRYPNTAEFMTAIQGIDALEDK